MPLIIDKHVVMKEANCHPSAILSKYTNLKRKSIQFIEDAVSLKREISGSCSRLLYVGQGEYAVVSNKLGKGNFEYVASDDATTCHIVILTETETGTVAVGHFDGSCTLEGMLGIISEIKSCVKLMDSTKTVKEMKMFIFGGFIDKKKYSEKIFADILQTCTSIEENINLELACSYSINNLSREGKNYPFLLGAGVNVNTLEVLAGSFVNRGPDLVLRGVRLMYNNDRLQAMQCIYDNEEGCICIHPFTFHCKLPVDVLLNLPDDIYLENFSTSPQCEPKYFVRRSKTEMLFAWTYKDKCDEIFRGNARKWHLNEDFKWSCVSQGHSVLPEFEV